ncbi:MAG: copper homeostasis protein CutC [Muribaculaceae bacterium]|nr:copper homeostasis protein CutC [Muribaculaceae bacterium]MDE6533521.1 copper homeostasis protein CutC [Muribaculaceae bacterium]
MKDKIQLEICCGDLASVIAAKDGGAQRIELCSGLYEGGLTPSIGLIKAAVGLGIRQVNVLIRPRTGDFLYSDRETELMETDIKAAVLAGASGVVIGALSPDGNIDKSVCERLIATAKDSKRDTYITFHRAFDLSSDPFESLETIIGMGCDCLLTSGMAQSAVKGLPMLKQLAQRAAGRISIMAGAGVNPANAADIITASGVTAIHSTARKPFPSKMVFRRPSVSMGAPGMNEYAPLSTSPDAVAALVKITDSFMK